MVFDAILISNKEIKKYKEHGVQDFAERSYDASKQQTDDRRCENTNYKIKLRTVHVRHNSSVTWDAREKKTGRSFERRVSCRREKKPKR